MLDTDVDTDDLQYVVAQVLTEVTGSPEWDEAAALQVKEALGEDAVVSPYALVEAAARDGLLSAVRAVMEIKHAEHNQQSHGNWAKQRWDDVEETLHPTEGWGWSNPLFREDAPDVRDLWDDEEDYSDLPVEDIPVGDIDSFQPTLQTMSDVFDGWQEDPEIGPVLLVPYERGGERRYVVADGNHRVAHARFVSGSSTVPARVLPEVKHGGPGPHSSGSPQAIHGSWAERLGRLIGLPDDLIDTEPDAGDRLRPDHPDAVRIEGETDFMEKLVTDFLPEPDPVTFDMSWAEEALEDEDHPLNEIASTAAHLMWISRGDEIEDLDVIEEGFEDLYSAFDDFDDEMDEILDDLDLPEPPDSETYANMDHEVREEYTQRVSAAVDDVHSTYIDFAAGFHESAVYEAESSTRYDKDAGARWARNAGYTKDMVPYDKWESPESLARSEAAAQELKHATATGLAKGLTEEQGETLRAGYYGNQFRHGSNGEAYTGANSTVGAWAQSSNDEHAPALFMQEAAIEEFGLHTYSEWTTDPYKAQGADRIETLGAEEFSTAQGAVLQQMYANTQQHFKDMGITHLRLHRGQREWDGTDRPLASWSMSEDTASGFARGGVGSMAVDHDDGPVTDIPKGSVLRSKTFPVEQVLCFPGTGFGCLNEYEVVVLANPPHEEAPGEDQLRLPGAEEWKHAGPGPHPTTGTPQSAHGSALGKAMSALTKMLADPDWRFLDRFRRLPGHAKTGEDVERALELGEHGKTWEMLAEAATAAYKEFFTENPRVRAPQVTLKRQHSYYPDQIEESTVHWVQPDPDSDTFARLPSVDSDPTLRPVWNEEEGRVEGWHITKWNYANWYDPHPLEIEETKHLLDSTEKYEALHTVEKHFDLTDDARTILDFDIPEGLTEDEQVVVEVAIRRLREGIYAKHRDMIPEETESTVWGAVENGAIRLRRLRPETVADRNRVVEERDEIDDLLGVTSGVVENLAENIRMIGVAGESVRRGGVPSGVEPPPDPYAPLAFTMRSMLDTDLKADVAQQVAREWETDAREWEEVALAMERIGAHAMGHDMESTASNLIRSWAETSNDEHDVSLAVQDAAARAFRLSGTAGWHKDSPDLSDEDADLLDDTLRRMYDRTQARFEEAGITEVRVHRGQSVPAGWSGKMRPMSSWSVQESEARSFAGGAFTHAQGGPEVYDLDEGFNPSHTPRARAEEHGAIFSATVPVSRVLCTPKTGFGCLSEYELVLLGGPLQQMTEPLGGVEGKQARGRPEGFGDTPTSVFGLWYSPTDPEVVGASKAFEEGDHAEVSDRVKVYPSDADVLTVQPRVDGAKVAAMRDLDEAGVLTMARLPDGRLVLVDGHHRWAAGTDGHFEVDVFDYVHEPEGGEIKHLPGMHDQSTHGNWARGLLPDWQAVRDAVGAWTKKYRDDEPLPGRLERTFDPEPEYKRRTGPFVHEVSSGFRQDVTDRVERIKAEDRVKRITEGTGVEMPPVVAAKHWDPERMDEFDPHRHPAPVGHTEFEGGLIMLYEDMVQRTQSPPFEDWDPGATSPTRDGTDTLVSGGLDAAIRHEYGHSLWYAKIKDRHPDWERFYDQGVGVEGKGIFGEWTEARRAYSGARLEDAQRVREAGGSVAEREAAFRRAMNRYASTSMSEAFAEQVSYLLDPRFDPDNFTPEGLDLLRITARLLDTDPGEFGL